MKKFLRTFQTNFPWLQDLRFSLQITYSKLFKRPHEYDFRAISLFPRNKNDIYIDVGANRGMSIQSILVENSECKIISFEPNPLVFNKLDKLFGRDKRVVLYNYGLGNRDGEMELFIPFYKKYMFDALASLDKKDALNWLKSRLYGFRQDFFSIKRVKTRLKKLDDFGLAPLFIKIDVQGYEKEVLLGGEKTLKCFTPILLIESPAKEVTAFLKRYNYKPYKFDKHKSFVEGRGDLNTFYITKEKLNKIIKK